MNVNSLSVENYRNIGECTFKPCETVNIIYGNNAQGKTNLVEAVWLFTGAKSFRAGKDADLIRFGQERAKLSLSFDDGQRIQTMEMILRREQRRELLLNDIPVKTSAQLAGNFYAVVFSPAHLTLVKDGPAVRRRFLDSAICQLMPRYITILSEYQKLLAHRNALLRDAAYHAGVLDLLEVFDQNLARCGAQILKLRLRYLSKLQVSCREIYSGISQARETLSLAYLSETGAASEDTAVLRDHFALKLRERRAEDIRAGQTSVGPHRDDLTLEIDGQNARLFGSQGQQRSCVLALKLAEAQILEESAGQPPVILLDDVMSELDPGRREYLLNRLAGRQVFITCCERAYFEGISQAKSFLVKNGAFAE